MSDLLLVLDAVGASNPVLVGTGASGAVNALFAATKPERVAGLVWLDGSARYAWAPTIRGGERPRRSRQSSSTCAVGEPRSTGARSRRTRHRSGPIPETDIAAFSKASRNACTPDVAIDLARMWAETDVREILPAIQAPTLILALSVLRDVERSRSIVERIPGATFIEVAGEGFTRSSMEKSADEIRRFVGAARSPVEIDSSLSTVLFTDIVGSTERATALGDRRWGDVIESHHARVRDALERWHGTEHDTAGDGFFATFEGPARAIRCAHEIVESVGGLGIEIRAGVHTGECRVIDGKMGGIAVAIGARVAATAGPSEVRVSQTVKDLVAGSGLTFHKAGDQELKGIPGRWHLSTVPDT